MNRLIKLFLVLCWCNLLCNPMLFALTIDDVFLKIKNNGPMLKEAQLSIEEVKSSDATILAAPEFSISEMNSKTPFFDKEMKMQRSYELSQMLPNPYRIYANQELKKNAILNQDINYNLTFKKIRNEAFVLFIGLYQNKKENELLAMKKSLIEKFIARLSSSQVQGQEERIQVSEAQIDLNEIKLNLKQNENEFKRMKNMLNQMMGDELESEVTPPELPKISMEKLKSSNSENILDVANNSELKEVKAKINLMEADLSMKRSEFYPEFSLKAKINKSYQASIEDSKELMVGVTLPFFFWGQNSNALSATHYKVEAMKFGLKNTESSLQAKIKSLKSEIIDLDETINFLKESSLPLREKKFKLYGNYSYTDMRSLMNYKMSVDDVYMLKMKILEKEMELQKKYFEYFEIYN